MNKEPKHAGGRPSDYLLIDEAGDFDWNKTMAAIDLYSRVSYSKLAEPEYSKVFYSWNEWSGWRFWFKALSLT